jgi:hypothetical protein
MSEEHTNIEVQEQETVVEQIVDQTPKAEAVVSNEDALTKDDKKSHVKETELPLEEKIQVCYYCQFFTKNQKCSLTNGEPKFLGKECGNFVENPKAKKNMWTSIIVRSIMAVLALIWGVQDVQEGLSLSSSSPSKMIWGFVLVFFGIVLLVSAYKGYKLNKSR